MRNKPGEHESELPPPPKYRHTRWLGGHLTRDPNKVKGHVAETALYSPIIGSVVALLGAVFFFKRYGSRGGDRKG